MIFAKELTEKDIGKKFRIVKKTIIIYVDDTTVEGDTVLVSGADPTTRAQDIFHPRFVCGGSPEWFYLRGDTQLKELTDE